MTPPAAGDDRALPAGSRPCTTGEQPWRQLRQLIGVAALCAAILAQLLPVVELKSATYDEEYHITRGLAYLRTGDARLSSEHPVLINALSALPLVGDPQIVLPLEDEAWRRADKEVFADLLIWQANANGPALVRRARQPTVVLTLLLAMIVYVWAREMYGHSGALLALTLVAFDPNLLAHGCLATNDVGAACFITLAGYAFWRMLKRPSRGRAVLAGITFGLAQTSKFSAVFLLPAFLLVAWADRSLQAGTGRTVRKWELLNRAMLAGVCAALTVWTVYGFQIGPLLGERFPVPAAAYLRYLLSCWSTVKGSMPGFLLGFHRQRGWWYYFPIVFAVKTPLPTMVLIGAAAVRAVRCGRWRPAVPLLIPVALYFAICLSTRLNIGYRHLLPALPFLFIFVGGAMCTGPRRGLLPRSALALLVTWLVLDTATTFPDYLAFFNQVVGGPAGGYRVLADSNLDWGQDLIGLRDYMAGQNISSVKLSYFGTAPPEAYGVTYEPLPGYPRHRTMPFDAAQAPPGVYAISATNLQSVYLPDRRMFERFRLQRPEAVIGHSIFIYRIPERTDVVGSAAGDGDRGARPSAAAKLSGQ